MVKPLNENSREIDMTTKTSFGYVLLKKAYTHVLGVDNNTNDQIEHCEEIIRQKGAMGHLQAKLITQSDEEFLLDSNFFLHFDYNECSDESESWALVSDVFGSPASVKTGYLYIKVDDLQKNKDGFIKELNKGRDLFDDPVTDFDTKFGLEGIKDAGIDPYEQFVGSFKVKEIRLTKSGDVYEINYILINRTHFKSAAYQAPGTSSWDRGSFKPGGTVEQHIEFKETLQNNKLNSGVLRYINHELGGLIRR